jgi:HD superfamily phosphodiesterase
MATSNREINEMEESKLLAFVKESTKHFDESHDWTHAVKVTTSTHIIMQSLDPEYLEYILVNQAAMLHDVCDHKLAGREQSRTIELVK